MSGYGVDEGLEQGYQEIGFCNAAFDHLTDSYRNVDASREPRDSIQILSVSVDHAGKRTVAPRSVTSLPIIQ